MKLRGVLLVHDCFPLLWMYTPLWSLFNFILRDNDDDEEDTKASCITTFIEFMCNSLCQLSSLLSQSVFGSSPKSKKDNDNKRDNLSS